jgi:hypothetical protein
MNHLVEENPFSVQHFNFSWTNTRKHTANLINRFPDKYKLAYFNDYHERIIMLINEEHNFFGIQEPQILIISKIDSSKDQCMLAFEMKGYRGDIVTRKDFDKGLTSLEKVMGYLKLFGTPVNN